MDSHDPRVVKFCKGLSLFDETGADGVQVDWRPPARADYPAVLACTSDGKALFHGHGAFETNLLTEIGDSKATVREHAIDSVGAVVKCRSSGKCSWGLRYLA